jgi:hypothetical protein
MVQVEKQIKPWEEYLAEGMEARESKDQSQWILGDLASAITVDYGENAIGKYSYAIGVEKKTLMNYRTVAGKFEKGIREKYRKLSFSHFAVLTATKKPEAWLEKADDDEWSVNKLRHEIKEAYGQEKGIKLDDEKPEPFRCPECGLWRLKDLSSFEICKGHYKINEKGEMSYY